MRGDAMPLLLFDYWPFVATEIQPAKSSRDDWRNDRFSTNTNAHVGRENYIRALSIDAVQSANFGHPGVPMGMADAATVLYRNHLKFDASDPDWPDRDRVVLSNGHVSMMLYSLLHLTGYEGMTPAPLRNLRQLGAIAAGHPEYSHASPSKRQVCLDGYGL